MAATAHECAVAFAALAGTTVATIHPENVVRGVRVGLPSPYFELVHSETRRAVEAAATTFEDLGAQVDWLDGPDVDPGFDGFHHVWADLAHHHRGF